MRVTFKDCDGKGKRLAAALEGAGHDLVDTGGDVLLIDADVPLPPYSQLCDEHERVVLYPHGAGRDEVGGDGQWPSHPNTIARLVIGQGQADMLAACGYRVPVQVIGWPFCDLRRFRPRRLRRVLFAPSHPMSDGWMVPGTREANRRVFDMLSSLPVAIQVRCAGPYGPEHIGLSGHAEEVEFGIDDAVSATSTADVVLAAVGTFPNLAVARGTPTVMFAQTAPHDHQNGSDDPHLAKNWDRYAEDVRFPLDADRVADAEELMGLLLRACATDEDIAVWRSRFVGEAMDPVRFVSVFESLCQS